MYVFIYIYLYVMFDMPCLVQHTLKQFFNCLDPVSKKFRKNF